MPRCTIDGVSRASVAGITEPPVAPRSIPNYTLAALYAVMARLGVGRGLRKHFGHLGTILFVRNAPKVA